MNQAKLVSLAIATLTALGPACALGQAWPARPVRIIVPFPPAGGVDTLTRTFGQKLSEQIGVNVLVENRPGAGGTIGADAVARAPADGYTLFVSAPEFAINAVIREKPPYDALKDFTHISLIGAGTFILASHPSVPAKTVKDVIALARVRPGQLTYGSSGAGGINHLSGELLQIMTGIRWIHVPFKGSAPSTAALMSGDIDFVFGSASSMINSIRSGRIKPIGITGTKRYEELPEVPTLAESGVPGYEVLGWYGFYGPAGMQPQTLKRLHAETVRALSTPEVKEKLSRIGVDVIASTPEEFTTFLRNEMAKWSKVVKQAKLKAE